MRVLTDFRYNYLNIKNTKPLAFNGNDIYYFIFENNFDETKLTVTRQLYKCNLRKCAYKQDGDENEIETTIGRRFTDNCYQICTDRDGKGKPMFGATVVFSSTVPRGRTKDIGATEFYRTTYATIYYQTFSARWIKEVNPITTKLENREKFYSRQYTIDLMD